MPDEPIAAPAGPVVDEAGVDLLVPRALLPGEVTAVDLGVDWELDGQPTAFEATDAGWKLRIRRPLAHRFEYQLVVHRPDGDEHRTDPTHTRTVPGPFGDKSEIVFDDYRPPAWLATAPLDRELPVAASAFADDDEVVPVRLITPADLPDDVPAPLLLAHDGSDVLERGGLARWAAAQPHPVRLALLDPALGRRNDWYATHPGYTDHLATTVLPGLREQVATSAVIGLGASLGALAMVFLHRRHPDSLDALALQSGSFFTAELDAMESGWPQFERVVTAVAAISAALPVEVRPVPVLMTVGAIEENRANNEQLAGALVFQGYPVDARIVPDAHTMVGWRDAWSPGLDELLARVVEQGGAAPDSTAHDGAARP